MSDAPSTAAALGCRRFDPEATRALARELRPFASELARSAQSFYLPVAEANPDSTSAVKAAVLAGADPNAPINGVSPLRIAAGLGLTSMARALLWAGADPNELDSQGWRPLHAALASGSRETIAVMLRGRANPALDSFWIPAHGATRCAIPSLVIHQLFFLLEHKSIALSGADWDFSNARIQGKDPALERFPNGPGIHFIEPLPLASLLSALILRKAQAAPALLWCAQRGLDLSPIADRLSGMARAADLDTRRIGEQLLCLWERALLNQESITARVATARSAL